MASSSPPELIARACDPGGGPGAGAGRGPALSALERRLLDEFQHDFPLVPRPYAALAERMQCCEQTVMSTLRRLMERGFVSRIGAVLAPHRVGASLLGALAVPRPRVDEVAEIVSSFREVNHNYEREHVYNLWFVITAPDESRLAKVLAEIEARTGLTVMRLPLTHPYHIDLGFPLWS